MLYTMVYFLFKNFWSQFGRFPCQLNKSVNILDVIFLNIRKIMGSNSNYTPLGQIRRWAINEGEALVSETS